MSVRQRAMLLAALVAMAPIAGCGSGSSPGAPPGPPLPPGTQSVITAATGLGLEAAGGNLVVYYISTPSGHEFSYSYRMHNVATGADFAMRNTPTAMTSFVMTPDAAYSASGFCSGVACIARWPASAGGTAQTLLNPDPALAGTRALSPVTDGRYVLWPNISTSATHFLTLYDTQSGSYQTIPVPPGLQPVSYDVTVSGGAPVVYVWSRSALSPPREVRLNRWTEAGGVTLVASEQQTGDTGPGGSTYNPFVAADGDMVTYNSITSATPAGQPMTVALLRQPAAGGTVVTMTANTGAAKFADGVLAWEDRGPTESTVKAWSAARGTETLGALPSGGAILFVGSNHVLYTLQDTPGYMRWSGATGARTSSERGVTTAGWLYYQTGPTIFRTPLN